MSVWKMNDIVVELGRSGCGWMIMPLQIVSILKEYKEKAMIKSGIRTVKKYCKQKFQALGVSLATK